MKMSHPSEAQAMLKNSKPKCTPSLADQEAQENLGKTEER